MNKIHLCDTCSFSPMFCDGNPVFSGDVKNWEYEYRTAEQVIECDEYKPKKEKNDDPD